MKEKKLTPSIQRPVVRLDASLDKYKDRVLFPKLLEKANAMLRLGGLPKLPGKG